MLIEIIMGFLFVLVLSDSRQLVFEFAKNLKIFYVLALLIIFIFNTGYFKVKSVLFKLFFPFFLLSFLVLFNSPDIQVGVQKTISYVSLFLIVPSFLIRDRERVKDLFMFVILILLIGLILFVIKAEFVTLSGRYSGVLGNPNGLGIFITLIFLLYSVINGLFPDLIHKNEKTLFYIVIIVSVIYSGSRTSLGAILFFLLAVRLFKRSNFLGVFSLIILFIISQLTLQYLPLIISTLGLDEFLRSDTLEDGSGRYVAWAFAWEIIKENYFLFGGGFSTDEYHMRLNYRLLSRLGHQGGVHSTYLSLWFNFGLVGLIIYFRSFFLSFIKINKKFKIALPIMFTVMLSITFESWLVASLNPYTIIFVIIMTLLLHYSENEIDILAEET